MKQSLLNTSALTSLISWKAPGCASLIAMLAAGSVAHAQDVTPVPDINVTDTRAQPWQPSQGAAASNGSGAAGNKPAPEGSEAAGYKPSTVSNFGPFGQTPILDVPYSVNVISSDLIENRIASSPEDVFKISPVVQLNVSNNRNLNPSFNLRGFAFTNQAVLEDGIRSPMLGLFGLEDKERVEIYTGLTGFLFGPSIVGGMVNYVYKRPTEIPLANVTAGDYGNLSGFVHGDFGGPIDKDGMFSYRLNVAAQDGGTSLDHQWESRQLVTGALDWHITPGTTVGVIGSHQYAYLHVISYYWDSYTYPNGASIFNYAWVPNPSKIYAQLYSYQPIEKDRIEVNLTSKLNEVFTARLAYAFTNEYEYSATYADPSVDNGTNNGAYSIGSWRNTGFRYQSHSGYGFLDAQFGTFGLEHKVTMGYYGYNLSSQGGAGSASPYIQIDGYNYYVGHVYTPPPNLNSTLNYYGTRYTTGDTSNNNIIIGDELKFNQ